ncbi:MAG: hypothetical protein ABI678_20880 [Kofleriaceae bacterium]
MLGRLAIASVILAGCKDSAPPPAPPPSDLVVVSSGVVPLHQLRYRVAKGTKTTLELELEGKLVAGEITSATPPLVFTLEVACVDVAADGKMKLTTTIQDLVTNAAPDQPGAPRAIADAQSLKGLSITATLAPDGAVTNVQAAVADKQLSDAAKAELDQLVQAMPKLAMPLPTTPIGIGAKWRSSRPLGPASPLALTSVTTIDISGITGTTLTYELSSTVHGADQIVKQDGVDVDVKSITGTATGHGTFDLSRLALTGTLSAELHMDMTTGSDHTPMTMALDLRTTSH